jgi:hypothetical protein
MYELATFFGLCGAIVGVGIGVRSLELQQREAVERIERIIELFDRRHRELAGDVARLKVRAPTVHEAITVEMPRARVVRLRTAEAARLDIPSLSRTARVMRVAKRALARRQ